MYKTAEYVSPAHPDKVCDQISDAILDACLEQDKSSRVAVETMAGHGVITITGEITSAAIIKVEQIVHDVLKSLRYNELYRVYVNIKKQSNYIAQGVDTGGAGDQGIMVGYATKETEELIPYELKVARDIIDYLREQNEKTRDAKSQVTTYNGKIESIVVSAERLSTQYITSFLQKRYPGVKYFVNPCGDWDGGLEYDTGVTGRKLAVDNYGPNIEIGGGAFSGKDLSKVDRSGAYMARALAVTILSLYDYKRCKTKVAYAIGVSTPVMISAETDQGIMEFSEEMMQRLLEAFKPETIKMLMLANGHRYRDCAAIGHFGRGRLRDGDIIKV